jgi:hypothetical protein
MFSLLPVHGSVRFRVGLRKFGKRRWIEAICCVCLFVCVYARARVCVRACVRVVGLNKPISDYLIFKTKSGELRWFILYKMYTISI